MEADLPVIATHLPGFLNPDDELNLTITIIIFAWALVMVWRGALLGARGHAKPRVFVAVALTAGFVLNCCALFGWIDPVARAGWSRGITWVLVLSLGWTATTGVRYGKKVESAFHAMTEIAEGHDDAE